MSQGLPHLPEPIESLRKRFDAALKVTYASDFVRRFPEERPGLKREHVFDFTEEGHRFRLIVSIDYGPDGKLFLHCSFSSCCGADHASAVLAFAKIYNRAGVIMVRRGFQTCSGVYHLVFDVPTQTTEGVAP